MIQRLGSALVQHGDVTLKDALGLLLNKIFVTELDSTGATPISSKLQAIIDANPGRTITLPAGNYWIDQTVFVPRNTTLEGMTPVTTMFHNIMHEDGIKDAGMTEGYTRFHLKGNPRKYVLTDVVHDEDDPAKSYGFIFAESGGCIQNCAILGYRRLSDGTFDMPSRKAKDDSGAVPCFDIPVMNASVMSVRMHGVLIAAYQEEHNACYLIDASRGENRNGSGNDFNVEDRIKSVGPNDSRQIDCCFWWLKVTDPDFEVGNGGYHYYGVKMQGHDDDIRNLNRYPGTASSGGVGAGNWIWGGPGTSDHKFRGSVIRGVSLDCAIRSYSGDDRLDYYAENTVGGANGYPGQWQNLTGAGGKISFLDCVIRQGDIYLNRVAYVWFANTYGEAGQFKMTNLTGNVTISDGNIGHSSVDITVPHPMGKATPTYNRLNSALFRKVNTGGEDRGALTYSSGSNAYIRPHVNGKVSLGFDDGKTPHRFSEVHAVSTVVGNVTSRNPIVAIEKPARLKSYATFSKLPTLSASDAGAMAYVVDARRPVIWRGNEWKSLANADGSL